jgi:hypothetical protein
MKLLTWLAKIYLRKGSLNWVLPVIFQYSQFDYRLNIMKNTQMEMVQVLKADP